MPIRDLNIVEIQSAGREVLAQRVALLQQERQQQDKQTLDLIDDRDQARDAADKLAEAVATLLNLEIGEHSNLNDPWLTALVGVQRAVSATRPSLPTGGADHA